MKSLVETVATIVLFILMPVIVVWATDQIEFWSSTTLGPAIGESHTWAVYIVAEILRKLS